MTEDDKLLHGSCFQMKKVRLPWRNEQFDEDIANVGLSIWRIWERTRLYDSLSGFAFEYWSMIVRAESSVEIELVFPHSGPSKNTYTTLTSRSTHLTSVAASLYSSKAAEPVAVLTPVAIPASTPRVMSLTII